MSNFLQPGISSPEDKFVPAESLGALLLFFPTQLQQGIKTAHGEADAIAAKIVRLDDGRVFDNALIFPSALVTQLKAAVPDGMVLGRLGQGENTKGNPPWLLQPHTEADVQQAEAWIAANPVNRFQQATPVAPPTAPAWSAPATPAAPAWGGQASAPVAPAAPAWSAPAAPVAVPVVSSVDPQLVAALAAKGINLQPHQTQADAESIWHIVAAQG